MGPLRIVQTIFTSLVLIFHSNLLNKNGPFRNFKKMYVSFYANYAVLDQIEGKTATLDKLLLCKLFK